MPWQISTRSGRAQRRWTETASLPLESQSVLTHRRAGSVACVRRRRVLGGRGGLRAAAAPPSQVITKLGRDTPKTTGGTSCRPAKDRGGQLSLNSLAAASLSTTAACKVKHRGRKHDLRSMCPRICVQCAPEIRFRVFDFGGEALRLRDSAQSKTKRHRSHPFWRKLHAKGGFLSRPESTTAKRFPHCANCADIVCFQCMRCRPVLIPRLPRRGNRTAERA